MLIRIADVVSRALIAQDAASQPSSPAAASQPTTQAMESLQDLSSDVLQLLGPTFEQTSLYGWFALMAAVLLGVIAGRVASAILSATGTRLNTRGWKARGAVFTHAAKPANLALTTIGLAIGLQLIYLTDSMRTVAGKVIALLLIVAIGWFMFNLVALVDIVIRRLLRRTDPRLVETVVVMVRKTLRIVVMVMVALFVIQNVFEQNITAWLAGLGIAGLAVSLAAQDPIKNVFGSFTVLAERPFVLGDRVIFDGIDGTIENIGFRSTRIRTLVGHLVTVPNMKFTDGVIENITRRPSVRRIMNVTITYDTPPEKVHRAVEILKDILAEDEVAANLNLPDQPPRVIFNDFNADSLNIFVIYWYAINRSGNDWWTYQAHTEMVNMKLLRAFNDEGIEFAFPTQTLFLAGDSKRELIVGSTRPGHPQASRTDSE